MWAPREEVQEVAAKSGREVTQRSASLAQA